MWLPFTTDAPWAILLANIEPESTAVTVNGLIPARSYQFRLCAVNDVGKGQFSKETDRWAADRHGTVRSYTCIHLHKLTSTLHIHNIQYNKLLLKGLQAAQPPKKRFLSILIRQKCSVWQRGCVAHCLTGETKKKCQRNVLQNLVLVSKLYIVLLKCVS